VWPPVACTPRSEISPKLLIDQGEIEPVSKPGFSSRLSGGKILHPVGEGVGEGVDTIGDGVGVATDDETSVEVGEAAALEATVEVLKGSDEELPGDEAAADGEATTLLSEAFDELVPPFTEVEILDETLSGDEVAVGEGEGVALLIADGEVEIEVAKLDGRPVDEVAMEGEGALVVVDCWLIDDLVTEDDLGGNGVLLELTGATDRHAPYLDWHPVPQ
jgi:hypothetical protein